MSACGRTFSARIRVASVPAAAKVSASVFSPDARSNAFSTSLVTVASSAE